MTIVADLYQVPAGTTTVRVGMGGGGGGGDTTPPGWGAATLAGTSVTTTSYTLGASAAATDNVGVTGYRYRINGGAWITSGSFNGIAISGRTPGATDACEMQARDAAGNWNSSISCNVTLQSAGAPAGVLATVKLKNPSTATVPFCFGHPFKKGDIPAGSGVAIGGANAQATVKNSWPDGSVKFAIIAGTAALTANVAADITLQAGTASSGTALNTSDLLATGVIASFDCGAFGVANWSNADFATPFRQWASGHRMSVWTYRKQVGSDPHLVAWMRVRLYAGGEVEVLPWVENGYLDVAAPVTKSATFKFLLGGIEKFSAPITLYARQRTPLLSGTVLGYWLATARDVVVRHDGSYLQSTRLVPAYATEIDPAHAQVTGLPSTFTPLQQGAYSTSLASGGFHNHVCVLPHWDALHLTTSAESTYKAVLFQAMSAGRYEFHLRDETSNLVPRIDAAGFANRTVPELGDAPFAAPSEFPAQRWSLDHQPMVGYLAYLLTGCPYFLEEVQFLASTNFFMVARGARGNGSGWFAAHASSNESVRTCAWGLRGLAMAAAITPDADPDGHRAAYLAHLKNNVDFYWSMYINGPHNPLGFVYPPSGSNHWGYYANLNGPQQAGGTTTKVRLLDDAVKNTTLGANSFIGNKILVTVAAPFDHTPTITAWTQGAGYVEFTVSPPMSGPPQVDGTAQIVPNHFFSATWMQDYSIAAWGLMKALELPFDATTEARREAFWLWHAAQIVGRMGSIGGTEYLYRDVAPYVIAMGPGLNGSNGVDGPNWITGAGPWHTNWGQVYDATFIAGGGLDTTSYTAPYALGARTQGPMRSTGFDLANPLTQETQFANAMRAIAYAVMHNVPGAEAGWHRIRSSANYHRFRQGMEAAGFSQGALRHRALPRWRRGQAVFEWREVPDSAMASGTKALPNIHVAKSLDGLRTATGSGNSYANRLDGYCGMTLDTRRSTVWVGLGGGHGDYWNNEVASLDLERDDPQWQMQHPGSGGNVVDDTSSNVPPPNSRARYADGLPCSRHTYYQTQFICRHNRLICTGGSISSPGTAYQDTEAYDVSVAPGSNGWDMQYTYPGSQGGIGAGTGAGGAALIAASACKDPTTEIIYTFSAARLHVLTPSVAGPQPGVPGSGGTYSFHALTWDGAWPYAEGATAVDTERGRILWTRGFSNVSAYTIDIATQAITSRTYTGAGAAGLNAVPASCGMIYVPRLDRYLVRGPEAGPTLYSINAATFEVTVLATTGGSGIPAQTGAGATPLTGVYNKWQLVPELGGAIYAPGAVHKLWFLRLW